MATAKKTASPRSKPAGKRGKHRVLKTAGVLAVIGAAAVAVSKGRKTARGRALEKKARTKGRERLHGAGGSVKAGVNRAARQIESRTR